MHFNLRTTLLLAAWASYCYTVIAIQQVFRKGPYLYTEDQNRFYIVGVAYQEQGAGATNSFGEPSTFTDPLALGSSCSRDLPYLQQLGINTIRVYSVNSSLNHDDCMTTFSNAGIYTIIDLSLPLNGSINRDAPAWSTNLLDEYIATINAFSKYDNVLAYNVGNEVALSNNTQVSPYIKAAARDVKAYLNSKNYSALVGYAAIDGDAGFRNALADYLSCDPSNSNSGATAIDIYGLNNYEWCGNATFESAYAATAQAFQGYNVVAYFSEFGCITSGTPRPWTEVAALYGSQLTPVWSGGIAFSYFPAESAQGQFGMVNISSDGSTVTTGQDFQNLKTEYGQISRTNSPSPGSASATYPTCPASNSAFSASSTLPPTPNEAACDCLRSTLGCLFTPDTTDYSVIVGELINTACSLLGQEGENCTAISGNGGTGVYGPVADCDPTIQLSYVMSLYYELNNHNPQACSFAGNGTVNPNAPANVSAANAAASSCISNPSATFVPTGAGTSTSTASGSKHNAAMYAGVNGHALYGITAMVIVTLASIAWTLF